MTRRKARVHTAVAVCTALVLVGCGSTVDGPRASSTLSTGTTPELSAPGAQQPSAPASGSGPDTGLTGPGGASVPGGVPAGGPVSADGTAPDGSEPGTRPTTASGANGPGVSPDKLYVGMVYARNSGAVEVGGLTIGDTQAYGNAFVKDINRRGGVGGRKLEAVWAAFDSASAETADQQWARICARFTEDQPVFAVQGAGTEGFRQCLHQAGGVQVDADLPFADAQEFARFPALIELGFPNLDRIAAEEVRALAAQDYFTPWDSRRGRPAAAGRTKVGVLTYDSGPFQRAAQRVLIPALQRLGHDPEVAYIGDVQTASDYGSQAAAVQSAQLRFAAAQVDHVISFEGNGGLSLFFMNQARSQGYYPRFGVTSASGTQALLDQGLVSANQVRGAMGFGWVPHFDVPNGEKYANAELKRCTKVLQKAGLDPGDPNARAVASGMCTSLELLKRVVDATPRTVNQSTFVRTVEALGSRFQAAGSLGTRFGPGRHDGVAKGYYWQFSEPCGCMRYVGPRRTIP